MNNDKLSFIASLLVVGTIAAMLLCRDAIVASLGATSTPLRRIALRLLGREEYTGKHRAVLA